MVLMLDVGGLVVVVVTKGQGDERNMSTQSGDNYFLCFNECAKHGYQSISVDVIRRDGSGHGTRVTPNKCCGAWQTVRKWMLSASEWKQLAEESRRAQRFAARQEAKVRQP